MTKRSLLLVPILVGLAIPAAATPLTPKERGVIVVSRHLLRAIGTPALARDVQDKRIRTDAYWHGVVVDTVSFNAVMPEIRRAIVDMPLVGARPPEPDVYAKILVRAIGPVPMFPLAESPKDERERAQRFASVDLAAFSRAVYADRKKAPEAARTVAVAARRAFDSNAIAEAFLKLGQFAAADDALVDLADTRDRLNEYLHAFGLHIFIEDKDLAEGKVKISGYTILGRNAFNILGKPFVIYEARPSIDGVSTSALGHAETEPGFLFVFANHVDAESRAGVKFLNGAPVRSLWAVSSTERPMQGLSDETVASLESAVRSATEEAKDPAVYRALLINTIGRHEGFHMYCEPMLTDAMRRGRITPGIAGCWHENGAYLYQLEVADPRFVHVDLLMLLMVALMTEGPFPDNTAGARAAFSDLQAYVPEVKFWDRAESKPIESGLPQLFRLPARTIQRAASEARWAFEVQVRN